MRRRNVVIAIVCTLAATACLLPHEPVLNAWVLDVGQGESVLVREPGGKTLLFDGGPDDAVLSRLGSVLPFWQRDIDLVVLSHTHLDHVAGLVAVLGRYRVRELWVSGAIDSTAEYREFERRVTDQRIPVRHRFWMDIPCENPCPAAEPFGVARLQVYHPMSDMTGAKPDNQHDADLVVKATYGSESILLTGDLNENHEHDMLAACQAPACTLRAAVLQAPHHGSGTGLTPAFLAAVAPRVAVIPVGADNKYRHPAPSTLEKLRAAGIPAYRTDLNGRIGIVLGAHSLRVERERDG